jgi:hypothetical protein
MTVLLSIGSRLSSQQGSESISVAFIFAASSGLMLIMDSVSVLRASKSQEATAAEFEAWSKGGSVDLLPIPRSACELRLRVVAKALKASSRRAAAFHGNRPRIMQQYMIAKDQTSAFWGS